MTNKFKSDNKNFCKKCGERTLNLDHVCKYCRWRYNITNVEMVNDDST